MEILDSSEENDTTQFAPEQLQLIKKLGQGYVHWPFFFDSININIIRAYGAVYQALERETGTVVAVKVIEISADKSNMAAVMQEIKILQVCS